MSTQRTPHERLLMDPGWRFHRGDIVPAAGKTQSDAYSSVKTGHASGPAGMNWDDYDWRVVDLPHDFVVEGVFTPEEEVSHGFLPTGVGWYRKSFVLPATDRGRRLWLEFDGVFRDATIWLNGHRLGRHSSGYIGCRYEITDQANYGGENVLAVRVDATGLEGWWYEGGGIYRHVWLVKTDTVAVAPWGVFVHAEVSEDLGTAEVQIQTELQNERETMAEAEVASTVVDAEGEEVAGVISVVTVPPGESLTLTQEATLEQVELWSVDRPYLYRLVTTVTVAGELVDQQETTFGARHFRFDPEQGFFLNGQPLKLKGTCNHQDHAGVGVAVPDAVQAFRIQRLKEMGCNAYRCAHNPPAPELLDACDRLGMVVMDENRYLDATPERLGDLADMIRRDRNHPSVIIWSMCNEEPLQGTETGARILKRMVRLVKQLDPTRPTICAISGNWQGGGFSTVTDLMGCNYSIPLYDAYHTAFPEHPMLGSETCSTVTTRGIYEKDEASGYLPAYDITQPGWGSPAEPGWKAVVQRPFMAGTFVWTGFDYRGEPTPYSWPCINSHFGIMDTCGFPKDNFFYYQSWWTEEPVLHILPHWNWPGREGEEIDVWVHSNCERVELFLNDESLGAQEMERNGHLAWKVKYTPGTLLARGYKGAEQVTTARVDTTGPAAGLLLAPDRHEYRADGEDVAVVTVGILDAEGRLVPVADNEVRFTVNGGARILGVGNGNPSSHEPDQADRRRAFNGLCQVLIGMGREPGEVVLTAHSPGLRTERVTLTAEPCQPRPYVPVLHQAQAVTSWRRSPLFEEEPAGTAAPPDWDQNAWQLISLGSGAQGEAGTGWVVFRAMTRTPAHHPQQEAVALRLEGICAPLKAYVNGNPAGEAAAGELTIPLATAPKSPLIVTLVTRQEGQFAEPINAAVFEREAKG